jgi:hypothetical protein
MRLEPLQRFAPGDGAMRPSAKTPLTVSFRIGAMMHSMTKDAYLTLQLSAICLLVYLNAMAVLAQHPGWFQ